MKNILFTDETVFMSELGFLDISKAVTLLDELSPRLQRFRMHMMRYNYRLIWCLEMDLSIVDLLSRNPIVGNKDGN